MTQLEDSEDCDIHTDGDRHAITLFNLSKTQSGQYMCIALSDQGKATKYFTITVTSKMSGVLNLFYFLIFNFLIA